MSEHNCEDVFEENVRRLIESSVRDADTDQDSAFEQKLIDSVLAEVAQVRAGDRAGRIRLIGKLTAAAVIVLAVGFLVQRGTDEHTATVETDVVARSPAEMLTLMSLTMAYRQGGIEAVERKCERALRMLGYDRRVGFTTVELFEEDNYN
jgi:hypothetical protein